LTSSGPISRKLPSPTPDAPCDDGRKKKTMIEYIYIYIYMQNLVLTGPPCSQRTVGHGFPGVDVLCGLL
jgi:hypothetical protein